ncbi:DUF3693 domain-containing protein [Pseudoxanthomonas sp.]|uniref:DUF3693 domain-containing protein n=1 Tax=Pseudoxanthomonas sp. TaxID=1871049 RepID=UPI00258A1F41|nr:DUF3693 domain-containing protein [Pseudoxanthomonas sp.]
MQHTDRRSLRTFAELVGVSHTKVAQWKNGDFPIPDDRIRQIAKLAAQDPGPWLLLIKSEQEEGELGREWAKLAKRLGAVGMAVLCAIGLSLPMAGNAHAERHADSWVSGDVQGNAYYVNTSQGWRAQLIHGCPPGNRTSPSP